MDNYNSLQEEKDPDDLVRDNVIRRNKKKISQGAELPGKSMLKKSDLSLVFLGAGIITLIIFFIFLRPSDDLEEEATDPENPPIAETVKSLEQKMTTLEEMLQAINASQAANMESEHKSGDIPDIKPYVARIERVETALSVKFDVLTARVDKMDDKLSDIIRDVEKNRRAANSIKQITSSSQAAHKSESPAAKSTAYSKVPNKSEGTVKPPTVNKAAANKKSETATKTVGASPSKQQKGGVTYHTVAKGDTLYNISKKYETTVDQLRAMNKMTMQDSIIIGQRIVVKK